MYDIVLFGNKGVGKSSIVSQYLDNIFPVTRKLNHNLLHTINVAQ
ncbi:MAG: hypothetical protein GY830_06065 [Bacteroidetes bacterium]|nr:hypothetical protein [Bacteroidota bacterium]